MASKKGKNTGENELLSLRKEINEVDNQIIDLLEERFVLSRNIDSWKKRNKLPILDRTREKAIIQDRINKSKLNKDFVKDLFELILKESRRIQGKL